MLTNVSPLKTDLHCVADDIFILFISQGLMALIYEGVNARKIFVYFYFLPTAIALVFLPRTPPLSTPLTAPFSAPLSAPLSAPTRKRKGKRRSKRDKNSAAERDPGEEKPLSLVLPVTTPSPQPLTPTPSLIVSETILGVLFFFPSTSQTHNYLTFQVAVRTGQSSTKVHFKAEPSPSNVTNRILYP